MSMPDYERLTALKEFNESKAGVKGLVDSGITSVPPIFHHANLFPSSSSSISHSISIPTIDLSLPRPTVVNLIRSAASTIGFFYVTNHGVPIQCISGAISTVRSFDDLPLAARSPHYSHDFVGGVSYVSNFDLFISPAASWRDTIRIQCGPVKPDPQRIPEICRDDLIEFEEHMTEAEKLIMGMMAEGLGVEPGRLEEMTCHEGRIMSCHYYPWCPEPDRTVGIMLHSDPVIMTMLAQDSVGWGVRVDRRRADGGRVSRQCRESAPGIYVACYIYAELCYHSCT